MKGKRLYGNFKDSDDSTGFKQGDRVLVASEFDWKGRVVEVDSFHVQEDRKTQVWVMSRGQSSWFFPEVLQLVRRPAAWNK